MGRSRIVLAGISQKLEGLRWESDSILRIGRKDGCDIFLNDTSVTRQHAEVVSVNDFWVVRDLANSERYLTLVNGHRVGRFEHKLRPQDVLHIGTMVLKVLDVISDKAEPPPPAPPADALLAIPDTPIIKTSGNLLRIQASTQNTWDEALLAVTRPGQEHAIQGQHLLALLRTNHSLGQIASLDELLLSILADVVQALNAQRGSILLEDPETGELKLRAVLAPRLKGNMARYFSRTMATRCYTTGESILCRDSSAEEALQSARSVRHGEMSSLICTILRSPRKRLGVLQLDRGLIQEPFDLGDFHLADAIAASFAIGIESAQLVEQQRDQFVQTVTTLARAVELRDHYTGDHTRRVTEYSLLLADELKLDAMERYQIQIGGPLHDIGKIGIDDSVLRKAGKLTIGEFEHMKQHTIKGAEILQSISNLNPMIPIIRHHHEKWDGSGYPDGLRQEQIARTARVVAVADAFDAMTSNRPYRPALSAESAFTELLRKAGSQFDPSFVQAFLRVRHKVEEMMSNSA